MHRSGTGLKARKPVHQLARQTWRKQSGKVDSPEERFSQEAGRAKRHPKNA